MASITFAQPLNLGYTHYYEINTDTREWRRIWPTLIRDTKRIIAQSATEVAGPNGMDYINTGVGTNRAVPPAIVDVKQGIGFNGIGEEAEEPLLIDCKGHFTRGYIRTARKPYDEIVTCVFLRAYMLAPNSCQIRSDGTWHDWIMGRDQYVALFKKAALCPWEGPKPPKYPRHKLVPTVPTLDDCTIM